MLLNVVHCYKLTFHIRMVCSSDDFLFKNRPLVVGMTTKPTLAAAE